MASPRGCAASWPGKLSAHCAANNGWPSSEPPEPEGRVEPARRGLAPEDRFVVIGVLVLALIAGIVLMLVSYLDSVN